MPRKNPADQTDGKGYITHVAYDSVIFGFSDQRMKILIMEYHNTGLFALPGGFVRMDEDLDDAVRRGLEERTGLTRIYLEQFYTFGNLKRHKPEVMKKILKANGYSPSKDHWLLSRFISVCYYALINFNDVEPRPDKFSDSCAWYDTDHLPELILDHRDIVDKALHTLKLNLDRQMVGKNLMPEKFTMNELQKAYECILGEKLRRTSFQRKMLSLDILKRHEKQFTGKAHKAPFIYSFKG